MIPALYHTISPMRIRLCRLVLFLALFLFRSIAIAQGPPNNSLPLSQIPLPTKVEFAEVDLRGLFPLDGQLMEQGTRNKEYVGMALGYRVEAKGKNIVVSNQHVGLQGVVFREGYIEINIGAHAEKEEKILLMKPMFSLNTTLTARIWFTDNLQAKVALDWHTIDGDNLGGKLVVPFAKGEIKKIAQRQADDYAAKLSETLRKSLPDGLKLRVEIRPGTLTVIRLSPSPTLAPVQKI
jgi:hypothetical protein